MRTVIGNIWDYHDDKSALVIPINIGWKRDKTNAMGRGLARQAALKYPELPSRVGTLCRLSGSAMHPSIIHLNHRSRQFIAFPSKPLNIENPHLSWRGDADYDLIRRGLDYMIKYSSSFALTQRVLFPLVGCGNGGLLISEVLPLLDQLEDEHFLLVVTPKDANIIRILKGAK